MCLHMTSYATKYFSNRRSYKYTSDKQKQIFHNLISVKRNSTEVIFKKNNLRWKYGSTEMSK